jgi:hypothetical protein
LFCLFQCSPLPIKESGRLLIPKNYYQHTCFAKIKIGLWNFFLGGGEYGTKLLNSCSSILIRKYSYVHTFFLNSPHMMSTTWDCYFDKT